MESGINSNAYENMYQGGYGHLHPESHIIRVHRQILEWELGMKGGTIFDFGCGRGANLSYFAQNGYVPYGCDTSATAIEKCRLNMPQFAENFSVSTPYPDMDSMVGDRKFDIFLSNQVLYFLPDSEIKALVDTVHSKLLRPGGVFIATMMDPSCWFSRYAKEKTGDFTRVEIETKRQRASLMVNFKSRDEAVDLFSPFKKLHLGLYGDWIREDEGPATHWLYVGTKS